MVDDTSISSVCFLKASCDEHSVVFHALDCLWCFDCNGSPSHCIYGLRAFVFTEKDFGKMKSLILNTSRTIRLRAAAAALAVGCLACGSSVMAQDPTLPDLGYDPATTVTAFGTKVGVGLALVIGFAFAVYAVLYVARLVKAWMMPAR